MIKNLGADLGGISVNTILRLGQLERLSSQSSAIVYCSGSLVEGYGNSLSDIDIFVISDSVIEGEIVTKKKDCTINIVFYGGRRIDYEFYQPGFIFCLSDKLQQIKIGEEFVAEKLSLHEELFIHRLKVGIPLINNPEFIHIKSLFDYDHFRRYLVQQSIHMIDGAIEDITGYVEQKDWNTALLRCVNLVGFATDAYCYQNDCTNTLPKWRDKKLKSLSGNKNQEFISHNFWNLSFPCFNNETDANKEDYVIKCLQFANIVVEGIQNSVNDD